MNEALSWRELLRQSDWQGREQDFPGALRLAREALAWAKREFGEASYEVAETWEYVAKAASFNKDEPTMKAAQEAAEKLLDDLEAGGSVPNTPAAASRLVFKSQWIFARTGNEDVAIKMLNEALAIQEAVLGADHPAVGYTAAQIGRMYEIAAQPRPGFPFHERAMTILEKTLGPRHIDVATELEEFAKALQRAGNLELPSTAPNPVTDPSQYSADIRSLYEKSLACLTAARTIRESHGEKDGTMYYVLLAEASALNSLGRPAEATPLENRAKATLHNQPT
jgi:tetratricopeptide (TPR) repeat protein